MFEGGGGGGGNHRGQGVGHDQNGKKADDLEVLVLPLWKTTMVMTNLATTAQIIAVVAAAAAAAATTVVAVEVTINSPSFLTKKTTQKIDCPSFLMKTTTTTTRILF